MILEQDCRSQTTATYWRECMGQIQLSMPEWKPAQKDNLGNRIKKYINNSLTQIFWANNDDIGIGICIWRNDGKSPVWITEWNQRRSSTIKEIEEMSVVAVVGSRKGFYFKSPNLKKLLLLKNLNNRGNIIQLRKETAYLPPSCTFLRETIVNILLEN